jgi:hypothetical protein
MNQAPTAGSTVFSQPVDHICILYRAASKERMMAALLSTVYGYYHCLQTKYGKLTLNFLALHSPHFEDVSTPLHILRCGSSMIDYCLPQSLGVCPHEAFHVSSLRLRSVLSLF